MGNKEYNKRQWERQRIGTAENTHLVFQQGGTLDVGKYTLWYLNRNLNDPKDDTWGYQLCYRGTGTCIGAYKDLASAINRLLFLLTEQTD